MVDDDRKMAKEFLAKYPNAPTEKTKKENYLSPSRVLPESDFQKYREMKQQSEKYRYLNKIRRLERENKINRNRESYGKTRSGRFGKGIAKGLRYIKSPSRMLYSRHNPVSPQRKMQLAAMRQTQVQHIQNKNYWDWCFSNFQSPQFDTASQVEREINSGGQAHSTIGDKTAFNIGNEAFSSANVIRYGINPFNQVSAEANHHANFAHILPSLHTSKQVRHHSKQIIQDPLYSVSAEANIFSHILD